MPSLSSPGQTNTGLRCGENDWIDNASLADVLHGDVADDTDIFGKGLALAGFDRLTPQQAMLLKNLEDAGIPVHECRQEDGNVSAQVLDFADAGEEIRAAAVWARGCIEEKDGISVGIITPDLRKLRTRIRYIFEDVLAPGNLRYRDVAAPLPFSISVGQPLADYPLVNAIFPILGLNKAPLALDTLGFLLRTPFIKGHDKERAGRALLDETLRSRNQLAFNWNDLLYLAGAAGDKGRPIPVMTAMLREIFSVLDELPAKQSPEAWTGSFSRFLEIFGWPGERSLNSTEYQQVQSWHSALDSLVSLRLVNPVMSRADALSQLRRIAGGTSFQPKTAETPIQVLDPQGAAAMAFDRVWMLGLTEEALAAPATAQSLRPHLPAKTIRHAGRRRGQQPAAGREPANSAGARHAGDYPEPCPKRRGPAAPGESPAGKSGVTWQDKDVDTGQPHKQTGA